MKKAIAITVLAGLLGNSLAAQQQTFTCTPNPDGTTICTNTQVSGKRVAIGLGVAIVLAVTVLLIHHHKAHKQPKVKRP